MTKTFTVFYLLFFLHHVSQGQTLQPPSVGTSPLRFALRDTVALPDVPRDEVYSRAWRWFSGISEGVPSLLEEANKRFGRFTGTSSFSFESKHNGGNEYVKGRIYYNLAVYVEDGFYTYEITDFTHVARISFNTITTHDRYPYRATAGEEWHSLVWQEMKDIIKAEFEPMIQSLKANMLVETDKFDYYKTISEKSPTHGE